MEDFISGGEGVAYHNESSDNEGGAYRTDEAVDISENPSDDGYHIGWTAAGEWLKYNVNVTSAGTYHAIIRSAANNPDLAGDIKISIGGSEIASGRLPQTGGLTTFEETTTGSFSLSSGEQTLELEIVSGESNIDYIEILAGEAPAPAYSFSDFAGRTYTANASNSVTDNTDGTGVFVLDDNSYDNMTNGRIEENHEANDGNVYDYCLVFDWYGINTFIIESKDEIRKIFNDGTELIYTAD